MASEGYHGFVDETASNESQNESWVLCSIVWQPGVAVTPVWCPGSTSTLHDVDRHGCGV